MKTIRLSQDRVAIVDDEDYEKISLYSWCVTYNAREKWYAQTTIKGTTKSLLMHRYILNAKKGQIVDHINGNGLDNRKVNLRPCTIAQNIYNQTTSKHNKSGFKGVSWVKKHKKWYASIHFNYKSYNLGMFTTKEEAAKAYNEKAKEFFGEFAKLNIV